MTATFWVGMYRKRSVGVYGLGVKDFGFRVEGLGFRDLGLGFRGRACRPHPCEPFLHSCLWSN